jgi:hypothetical protein
MELSSLGEERYERNLKHELPKNQHWIFSGCYFSWRPKAEHERTSTNLFDAKRNQQFDLDLKFPETEKKLAQTFLTGSG